MGGIKQLSSSLLLWKVHMWRYAKSEFLFPNGICDSFLMGLKDSFAQIKAQLLLLDPIPQMNKVFSLVVQEEWQRNVTAQTNSRRVDTTNSLAFATCTDNSRKDAQSSMNNRNSNQRKERSFCTHCNFHGHTIEKCYKIHGYPPGYKPRPKAQTMVPNQISANQVSTQPIHDEKVQESGNIGNFIQSLNTNKYKQLMTMLSSHSASSILASNSPDNPTISYAASTCLLVPVTSVSYSNHLWIVDSGASRYICSNANMFTFLKPVWNSTVSLPNNTKIHVHLYGDIQLAPHFILKNVLFVPQFSFNLISVSAFAFDSSLIVTFSHDHFLIQDPHNSTMISRGNKF